MKVAGGLWKVEDAVGAASTVFYGSLGISSDFYGSWGFPVISMVHWGFPAIFQ